MRRFGGETYPPPLVPELKRHLAEMGREDMLIVVGGVIPPEDVPTLRQMGAAAVYPPGHGDRGGGGGVDWEALLLKPGPSRVSGAEPGPRGS